MVLRRIYWPGILLAVLAAITAQISPASATEVRVGLIRCFKLSPQVFIQSAEGFRAVTPENKTILSVAPLELIKVEATEKGIKATRPNGAIGNLGKVVCFVPNETDGRLQVSSPTQPGTEYRGQIRARTDDGKGLMLVNELDLEDYLLGVVAAEMPTSFPIEALKAQAVAARTFTITCSVKHAAQGYDLCDSTCCQVYGGTLYENEKAVIAVRETRGLILAYQGKPIQALYTADCGGYSECRLNSKGQIFPYLRSQPDKKGPEHPDFCTGSPSHSWNKTISAPDLKRLLIAAGVPVGEIKDISITERTDSNRANAIRVSTTTGENVISGEKLRHAVGLTEVKSTLFSVMPTTNGGFIIEGKGFGHGLGLCQYGAKGMASPPYSHNYKEILAHYYPGAELAAASMPYETLASSTDSANAEQKADSPKP